MSWIRTIPQGQAQGRLRQLYDRVKAPDGRVDNILALHSLRPHTLEGHLGLYKNVLHHPANLLPQSLLETLGVYVSLLNGCGYCVEHHFAGLRRLLADDSYASSLRTALEGSQGSDPAAGDVLTVAEAAALRYARVLTRTPALVREPLLQELREAGYDDGRILEINQVVAYFAYANRTVLGLGCTTHGDQLGWSPSNTADAGDWSHR